jgi:hypothetical protein
MISTVFITNPTYSKHPLKYLSQKPKAVAVTPEFLSLLITHMQSVAGTGM